MEETKIQNDNEVIDADALMAEFDRESNVRHFTGKKKIVIRTLMIAFALYAIITSIFGKYLLMLDNKIIAGLMTWPGSSTGFLGLILVITFLIFPAYKGQAKKINYIPWYDYILAAAGFASFFLGSAFFSCLGAFLGSSLRNRSARGSSSMVFRVRRTL